MTAYPGLAKFIVVEKGPLKVLKVILQSIMLIYAVVGGLVIGAAPAM